MRRHRWCSGRRRPGGRAGGGARAGVAQRPAEASRAEVLAGGGCGMAAAGAFDEGPVGQGLAHRAGGGGSGHRLRRLVVPGGRVVVAGREGGRRVGLGGAQASGDDRADRGPYRIRQRPRGDDVMQLLAAPAGFQHRGHDAALIGQRLPGQQQLGAGRPELEQQPDPRVHLIRRGRGRRGRRRVRPVRPSRWSRRVAAARTEGLVFC